MKIKKVASAYADVILYKDGEIVMDKSKAAKPNSKHFPAMSPNHWAIASTSDDKIIDQVMEELENAEFLASDCIYYLKLPGGRIPVSIPGFVTGGKDNFKI